MSKKELFSFAFSPIIFSLEFFLIPMTSLFCFPLLNGNIPGQFHLNIIILANLVLIWLRPSTLNSNAISSTVFSCLYPYSDLQSLTGSLPTHTVPTPSTTILLSLQILLLPGWPPCSSHMSGRSSLWLLLFPDFHMVVSLTLDLLGLFSTIAFLVRPLLGSKTTVTFLPCIIYLLDTYHHPTYYLFH